MEKMNKLVTIIGVVSVWVSMSCSNEFLHLDDPNNATEETFWKTEADAMLGLAGVLDVYQSNDLMGKRYREFDHLTDNATTVNSQGWLEFENDTHTPSSPRIKGTWTALYTVINRANEVMVRTAALPEAVISAESRARIIAEAAFLRAYAYHDLVALWGDVPLYLEPKGAFGTPEGATAKAEIIDFLLTDLATNVIPNLPEVLVASENGRISGGAAQALVGKLYLLRDDWEAAAAAFREIIDAGNYALYPDFGKLFTEEGEFSEENLFEINFVGSALDRGEQFSTRVDTNLAPAIPSTFWTPLTNLRDSYLAIDGKPIKNDTLYGTKSPYYNSRRFYDNRDPRLQATLYTAADTTAGGAVVWKIGTSGNGTIAVKKYSVLSSEQVQNQGPQNYYVIRYAEVLLSYAEAQNEAAGPDQSVYDAINAVRDRVGMPHLPEGLSQHEMQQYIRDERRWEFALEHQRFFDLKRWGILGPTAQAAMPNKKLFSEPRIFSWPYPLEEMDRNPELAAQGQNDGY